MDVRASVTPSGQSGPKTGSCVSMSVSPGISSTLQLNPEHAGEAPLQVSSIYVALVCIRPLLSLQPLSGRGRQSHRHTNYKKSIGKSACGNSPDSNVIFPVPPVLGWPVIEPCDTVALPAYTAPLRDICDEKI